MMTEKTKSARAETSCRKVLSGTEIISCPAKINLFLAIRGKDKTGYHKIETVMARADSLCDFLHIQKSSKFSFTCPRAIKKNNTVLKAVKLLQKTTGKKFHYEITLKKQIPIRAGFGGGSSDAAAILIYLNRTEKLKLTKKELMNLGTKIGMDVPFFISEFPVAKCTHYGEKITRLPALPKNIKIALIKTNTKISTRAAYAKWDRLHKKNNKKSTAKIAPILAAIKNRNAKEIIKNLHNDFEKTAALNKQKPTNYCSPFCSKILAGSGGSYAVLSLSDKK